MVAKVAFAFELATTITVDKQDTLSLINREEPLKIGKVECIAFQLGKLPYFKALFLAVVSMDIRLLLFFKS